MPKEVMKLEDYDGPAEKMCNHCDTIKPITEFYWYAKRGMYLTPCRQCRNRLASEWVKKNRERHNQNVRNHRQRRREQG
jgi:hypothetical protein